MLGGINRGAVVQHCHKSQLTATLTKSGMGMVPKRRQQRRKHRFIKWIQEWWQVIVAVRRLSKTKQWKIGLCVELVPHVLERILQKEGGQERDGGRSEETTGSKGVKRSGWLHGGCGGSNGGGGGATKWVTVALLGSWWWCWECRSDRGGDAGDGGGDETGLESN